MKLASYSIPWRMLGVILLLAVDLTLSLGPSNSNSKGDPSGGRKLAPCQACKALVNSFELGMEKTAKGHYGGGDTAWEEANKKDYKNSELRLVEIQEHLCTEVTIGKDQCHEIGSENEHLLEEWWSKYRNAGEDLLSWLCTNKLKVCCPDKHFGPNCLPCKGYPDNVCGNHGKCKGSGTRKGNGECSCHTGYTGKSCNTCADDHYEAFKDDEKLICSACHKSCFGGCSGAGTKTCHKCKEGWEKDEERGCIDINECLFEETPCRNTEFCVNMEGSHSCIACDKACDGCFGDGPDMCDKCANGYILVDKFCIDGSTMGRTQQMNTTRYLTYLGLCVATCIIFQKNVFISAIVGIAVAIYISASEYLLRSTASHNVITI